MLDFENQIFLDVLHQDGLLITAKGLSLETIFLNIIKVYSDPGNLVIVIGTTQKEEEYFLDRLLFENLVYLPKIITDEYNASERDLVYLQGGVLFVSSRILVVDLLKNRLPIDKVTGVLVYRAHSILDSCQEAFAIQLFRQRNKTGFIKAFSSSPQALRRSFAQVQHIMNTLFVCQLYLWPRYNATVRSNLDTPKLCVVELHVQMTANMKEIQGAVLDLISVLIKDLKAQNTSVNLDEVTVENIISHSFHKLLHQQLDPQWHQLNAMSHKILVDLRSLCCLLTYLTRYDCVSFYNLVCGFRSREYVFKCSGWCLLDSAETLFVVAEKRASNCSKDGAANPEVCPKWDVLAEVLNEINRKSKDRGGKDEKALILASDKKTCEQIKQFLTLGAKNYLLDLHKKNFKGKASMTSKLQQEEEGSGNIDDPKEESKDDNQEEANRVNEEEDIQDFYMLTQKFTQEEAMKSDDDMPCTQFEEVKEEEMKQTSEQWMPPMLYIQPFKRNNDPTAILKTLDGMMPNYVIMYDMDIATVRRLEVFNAKHPEVGLMIFVLIYGGTVEEQAYLTTLKKEREAFDFLINEKMSMETSTDQDGLSEDNPRLTRDVLKPNETVTSTRKGGMPEIKTKKESRIIVDMREFRSELPALIYKRGIEMEPVTLYVGDYILTPEICVERKSISDLIGSLNSGRLYNQAVAMTRHYAKPMLLIEFDSHKPFVPKGQYFVNKNVASKAILAKLQLLTLHFPKLKLLWSSSSLDTAELFDELKQGQPEPIANIAAAIGAELETEINSDKFNSAIADLIAKLPGVTTKNLKFLLSKGNSLDYLVKCSKEDLQELLGNSLHAGDLHAALHSAFTEESNAPQVSRVGGSKGRGGKWQGFKKLKKKG